jgi:hypothetical protein
MLHARTISLLLLSLQACALRQGWNEDTQPMPGARPKGALGPISLTSPDGTGLALRELDAQVVMDGPLAFTELHLTFQNPEARRIEGRFQISLPDGAAVSRLAMASNGRWLEGEIVDKDKGRAAYEDSLHRRVDPALLEKGAGNTFSARIFPIEANERKEIILSYSEELTGEARYTLPLRGLPAIDHLSIRGLVLDATGARSPVVLSRSGVIPEQDFTLHGGGAVVGLKAGDLAVARVKIDVASGPPARPTELVILVDTSASRAGGFEDDLALLGQIIDGLDDIPLQVAAFDQEVVPVFSGTARGFGGRHLAQLRAREALGASHLGAALGWAARTGKRRVLLLTDGVASLGPTTAPDLTRVLAGSPVRRLDIVPPRDGDRALLRALVAGTPEPGLLLEGDAVRVVAGLAARPLPPLPVSMAGATWLWPATLTGVATGDEVLIYARGPALEAAGELQIRVGGEPRTIPLVTVERPLLERAAARAEIAQLASLDPQVARPRIVELATKHRLVTEVTSLVVLENESGYERWGIDRTATADVLVVGDNGVERTGIKRPQLAKPAPVLPARIPGALPDHLTGTIEGQVLDETKQPVLLATMLVTGPALTGEKSEFTDQTGKYRLAGLPPGVYTLQAFYGDARVRRDNVIVQIGKTSVVNLTMSLATGEVIAIRERAPTIDSGSTKQGVTLTQDYIRRVPAGRTYENVLGAGAGSQGDSYGVSFSGSTSVENGYVVDGINTPINTTVQRGGSGGLQTLLDRARSLEAAGQKPLAQRVIGSLLDLYPGRAELHRLAAGRLDALGATTLALDAYRKALADRPDHISGYRQLAVALLKTGALEESFEVLERGLSHRYPDGRFLGGIEVLRGDLGVVGAVISSRKPARRKEISTRLAAQGVRPATQPTLRVILTWETDANDVDLHIVDGEGGHAYYETPMLSTGGKLLADVTTGFGPELFLVERPAAYPYRLGVNYYSQGSMGAGGGKITVLEHDGAGRIAVVDFPFLLNASGAGREVAVVNGSLLR